MTSREQAIQGITTISGVNPDKEKEMRGDRLQRIEADGVEKYFSLRSQCSNWMVGWITGLIVFNIVLTASVGYGLLRFENMQWFISAITAETFLQIVSLGYISVKFLFSDHLTSFKNQA